MPELPEVEFARRLIDAVGTGRRIVHVEAARDPLVFEGVGPARVRRSLEGRRVVAVRRLGKHLYLELDGRPWPVFHFGMTGAFCVPGRLTRRLVSSRQPGAPSWPPRFTRLRLHLDDGGDVAWTDARRFGRMRLRHDPLREPPLDRLGFDPLLSLPPAKAIAQRLRGRRVSLKGLLLDQTFAAGVGNWMADEVLYQARLDPRREAGSLEPAEVRRLRACLRSVTRTAVDVEADASRYPRSWLFHHRWGRKPGARVYGGAPIAFLDLAGRTTAWVPSRQR